MDGASSVALYSLSGCYQLALQSNRIKGYNTPKIMANLNVEMQ